MDGMSLSVPLDRSFPGPSDRGRSAASEAEEAWTAERVQRARAGDREAFGDLYRRYARLAHGILLARMPAADVPDLVQEVFLVAYRKLGQLREPSSFVPWLATLARRTATDYHRSPDRRLEPAAEPPPGSSVAPELTADGLAVFQALSRLPETYRETLILRLVGGLSGAEISAATGLTEGSVRVNLCRGMKKLRARLEGEAHE